MIKYEVIRSEIEENRDLDRSKLFGAPVFPKDFLSKHKLNDAYYFAQINLTELAVFETSLPKEGMLYFFLFFDGYDIKAKVIYSNEELYEVMDDVNEMFGELDFKDALVMNFSESEGSNFILGEEFDQEVPEAYGKDYFILLKVDPLNILASDFPVFANPDDEIYFVMERSDYEKLNFKKVKLITHGS